MLGHEPTLIATTGYQMTASSPRGTFSQAELTADRVITRCITRSPVSSAQLKVSHRELAAVGEMGVPINVGSWRVWCVTRTSLSRGDYPVPGTSVSGERGIPLSGRRLGDVGLSAAGCVCIAGGWAGRVRTGMAAMDRTVAVMMRSGW